MKKHRVPGLDVYRESTSAVDDLQSLGVLDEYMQDRKRIDEGFEQPEDLDWILKTLKKSADSDTSSYWEGYIKKGPKNLSESKSAGPRMRTLAEEFKLLGLPSDHGKAIQDIIKYDHNSTWENLDTQDVIEQTMSANAGAYTKGGPVLTAVAHKLKKPKKKKLY